MDDAVADAWKELATKMGELWEETARERDTWKFLANKIGELWESSGTPGPSPGEPSGATPSETPPASGEENAAVPVIGRWRDAIGKWETREDAGREVADAPTPFAEQQEIESDTEEILEAIKEVLNEVRSLKGESHSGTSHGAHGVRHPSPATWFMHGLTRSKPPTSFGSPSGTAAVRRTT